MDEQNTDTQHTQDESTTNSKQQQKRQPKAGSVPMELRLPALDNLLFSQSRNGKWKADTDNKGRLTGVIRRALANVTFAIGPIQLTRTIWHERVKDRAANKFRDVYTLTVRDRYNVDYPSEAAEKAWSRWAAEVLADNGPFAKWQADQAELMAQTADSFDGRPRLVKTVDASDGDMAEYNALMQQQ